MRLFDALIYLADYIEENRTFEDCVRLREYFLSAKPEEMDDAARLVHLYKTMVKSVNMTVRCLAEEDGFIDAGSGGGIGWALVDDMTHAEVREETIIDRRYYHTIKEVKNGEGPHPIKTPKGWLHLAHGVRGCAAGLRYVLYMYMTSLEDPTRVIASPAGAIMVPEGGERVGDVSNVLFSNGWIADEDGKVFIYYASSDTRMHVATSTIDRLVDYCLNTPQDGYSSSASVEILKRQIAKNLKLMS